MARCLLDSNAFLRFKEDPRTLSQEARQAIEDPANELFVSLASIWELAIKAAKGKLPYFAAMIARGPEAMAETLRESSLKLLQVDTRHALASVALPQHHKDPFDRVMIAQALTEGLVLISSDRALVRYNGLRVLAA